MVVVATRRLTAVMAVLAAILVAAGCAPRFRSAFEPNLYTVRQGDTLYAIAWRYQIDYQDLLRWNDIDDPNNIHPGQRIQDQPQPVGKPIRQHRHASSHEC